MSNPLPSHNNDNDYGDDEDEDDDSEDDDSDDEDSDKDKDDRVVTTQNTLLLYHNSLIALLIQLFVLFYTIYIV